MAQVERITKLEAARRQLRTAIAMFFHDGDAVSVHTLVAAARQVLLDILKRRGTKGGLEAAVEAEFTPCGVTVFRKKQAEAENFFKHANRDPDGKLEFKSEQAVFLLVECAEAYRQVTGRNLRELFIFMVWFGLEYPDLLLPESPVHLAVEHVRRHDIYEDKKSFFGSLTAACPWLDLD